MTRAELLALAKRVETEEPSEELTMKVMRVAGWGKCDGREWWLWQAPDETLHAKLPDPLHSLDAAVTLVPEHWVVCDLYQYGPAYDGVLMWRCKLYRDEKTEEQVGTAGTEPRARTAAALRAKAQEAGDA